MKSMTDSTTVSSAYGSKEFEAQNPNGLKVDFSYDEYETFDEVKKDVSEKDLIDLCNARAKSNARSAAIAKATSAYKPDPNSPAEVRKRMINDLLKSKPTLSESDAAALVDSLLS